MTDELKQTSVSAFDSDIQVYVPNYSMERVPAGVIQQRSYETEAGRAKRLDYTTPDGKVHSLGITTRFTKMLDPFQVAESFTLQGYVPSILKISRGGTDLFGLFTRPDLTYNFDEEGPIELSFGVWHRMQPGKITVIRGGFFRKICSNGLVSSILELGSLELNHMQLTVQKIAQVIDNTTQKFVTEGYLDHQFPAKGLAKTIDILSRTTNEEQLWALPDMVAAAIRWFMLRTNKFRDSLLNNLDNLVSSENNPTKLQVVNAVTNIGVDYGELEHRPADLYWSFGAAITNLTRVAQLAEFFS